MMKFSLIVIFVFTLSLKLFADQLVMDQPIESTNEPSLLLEEDSPSALAQENYSKATHNGRITYYKNDFNYVSNNNAYKNTFTKSWLNPDALDLGFVKFEVNTFLLKRWLDFTLGPALGMGYARGKGVQSASGATSITTFSLFSVPLDLLFGAQINLSRALQLSVQGGPSILALYQTRDDFSNGEKGKNKTQFGFGHALVLRGAVGLTALFPSTMHHFYNEYDITAVYLDLEMRSVSYGQFKQSDLEVSGQSLGMGFTFEYY